MKKLISTALISFFIMLLGSYVFAQEMMEKSEKPCPMHEKMMQQKKAEMKDMGDKSMMMCPMCKMMKEGKMCPMHQKMMQQMHGGMGMMPGMPPDMMPVFHEMVFQLDLSKAQKEQINHLFGSHREEMQKLQSERQNAEMELNKVSNQDMPDLRHVRKLVQRIADLEADMKYSHVKVMVDVKSVLKNEQRANLKRKIEGKSPDKPAPKEKVKPDMPSHKGHKM